MENYTKTKLGFNETKDAQDLLGLRILSASGEVVGRVSKVRLDIKTNALEGLACKRPAFSNPIASCYFCKEYIDRVTEDAVLLRIEPAFIWTGNEVISADGKVLGRVNRVYRVNDTNEIESFFFKRSFFRTATVSLRDVKKVGSSIVLKKSYAEVKKNGFK